MNRILIGLFAAALLLGCEKKSPDTFRMVTEPTFPPYEFLRGQDIAGIDVEICRAIAAKLGKNFKAIPVDFDAIIPAVISGKAEIAAAGLTITEDRKRSVDFSDPYMNTGIVIIYKKSLPILKAEQCKGKRVGVQSGTTADEYTVRELKQEPERFHSFPEAVSALKAGRCDLVMCDNILARNCTVCEPDLALSDLITSEEYALAIAKGQPELLKTINETIAELKASGKLSRWFVNFTIETDEMKAK